MSSLLHHFSIENHFTFSIVRRLLSLNAQARLDQCRVPMETLEKQLEEEKQKAATAERQRAAGTGAEHLILQTSSEANVHPSIICSSTSEVSDADRNLLCVNNRNRSWSKIIDYKCWIG